MQVMGMDDAPRDKLLDGLSQLASQPAYLWATRLGFSKNREESPQFSLCFTDVGHRSQLADVARACNRFPGIALEYKARS